MGLTSEKNCDAGKPPSRANAQDVRLVDVTHAALAAIATKVMHRANTEAPAGEPVTFKNNCMKGNPVLDSSRDSRFPKENSRTVAYIRPITPLIMTLPIMANGTLRDGFGISSLKWHAASYLRSIVSFRHTASL